MLNGSARVSLAITGALLGALVLTGCGGSDGSDDDTRAAAEAQASAIESAAGGSAGAAPTSAAPDAAASPVSGEEFCAALRAMLPNLEGQPEDIAFVNASLELLDLYEGKDAVESMDASTMDALTTGCPDDAQKVLAAAGKDSFAEFR